MATREDLIARLNTVLSWEIAGAIQYLHGGAMLTGKWRGVYAEFFQDGSKEARGHAEQVAEKIVALGGIPTVEPARIIQATDVDALLEAALELEEAALAAWEAALEIGDAVNIGTGLWIEEMVSHEQEHVDELRKLTGRISFGAAQTTGSASDASA